MLPTIHSKTFCPVVCCLKHINLSIKNNNSPTAPYGCETWSLSLREEHSLMVFEKRVLRRIWTEER
jgi:hypothetical protein